MALPFSGDENLFKWSPAHFSTNNPLGRVMGHEVRQAFRANAERNEILTWVAHIKDFLARQRKIIDEWNAQLPNIVREAYAFRRRQLEEGNAAVNRLGFRVRQRTDAPRAYAVALPPKKLEPTAAQLPSRTPAPAEQYLPDESYEDILSLIFGMSLVFERSPSTFKKITKEEEIRMLLLIPLNGVFESATGETFNCKGDTDILIRREEKNLFIAECKFWKGPESFRETIDQLLSYLTWRDCKTAILLFVRDTKISTVLPQIPGLLAQHRHFVRDLPSARSGEFRAVLSGTDDGVRLTLSVLCFHIPG
jgi:hypothetical protein